jgi:hypothetical protein
MKKLLLYLSTQLRGEKTGSALPTAAGTFGSKMILMYQRITILPDRQSAARLLSGPEKTHERVC